MSELEFHIHLSEERRRYILEKYHFTEKEDFAEIGNMCLEIEQITHIRASYKKIHADKEKEIFRVREKEEAIVAAVTLGTEFDDMECGYGSRGEILKSYRMDCIGMEILMEVYDQMVQTVYEREGLWIDKFDFIGDGYPLSLLKEAMDYLGMEHIKYNESSMLIPKKSVVFVGRLSQKKPESGCRICKDCGNLSCSSKKEVPTG